MNRCFECKFAVQIRIVPVQQNFGENRFAENVRIQIELGRLYGLLDEVDGLAIGREMYLHGQNSEVIKIPIVKLNIKKICGLQRAEIQESPTGKIHNLMYINILEKTKF
jgi:hypothetical protein